MDAADDPARRAGTYGDNRPVQALAVSIPTQLTARVCAINCGVMKPYLSLLACLASLCSALAADAPASFKVGEFNFKRPEK